MVIQGDDKRDMKRERAAERNKARETSHLAEIAYHTDRRWSEDYDDSHSKVEHCMSFFTEDGWGGKKEIEFLSEEDGRLKKSKQTPATEATGIVESRVAD